AITSFTVSKPTETRTKPSVIPTASFSSTDNLLCVVDAGCVTIVFTSPILAEREHNFILSKNLRPASIPPLISKAIMLPPKSICFLAISYFGCDFKKGYFTLFTFGWLSKNSATFKAFSQCLSTRTAKVSKLFDKTQALNGDIAGPVFLEN